MLLADQIEIHRENLPTLQQQQFVLPTLGGQQATRQTYRFRSLVHPARDIATTIAQADQHHKLPGWKLRVTDGWRKPNEVPLNILLGRIIHVYYIHLHEGRLDLINDWGQRSIVAYDVFLAALERLVLSPEDRCLVICDLTRKKVEKDIKSNRLPVWDTPGYGDLLHLLASIQDWPTLQDTLWQTFFAGCSRGIEQGSQTINNQPFLRQSGYLESRTALSWQLGWRRDALYAEPRIDLLSLLDVIRSYFSCEKAT